MGDGDVACCSGLCRDWEMKSVMGMEIILERGMVMKRLMVMLGLGGQGDEGGDGDGDG